MEFLNFFGFSPLFSFFFSNFRGYFILDLHDIFQQFIVLIGKFLDLDHRVLVLEKFSPILLIVVGLINVLRNVYP